MDQPQYTSLLEALAVVPDPRKARGKRYPWLLLLTLLAAGLASGQQTARAWSGSCFSQRCSGPWIPYFPTAVGGESRCAARGRDRRFAARRGPVRPAAAPAPPLAPSAVITPQAVLAVIGAAAALTSPAGRASRGDAHPSPPPRLLRPRLARRAARCGAGLHAIPLTRSCGAWPRFLMWWSSREGGARTLLYRRHSLIRTPHAAPPTTRKRHESGTDTTRNGRPNRRPKRPPTGQANRQPSVKLFQPRLG
jgi:hypothetical protein